MSFATVCCGLIAYCFTGEPNTADSFNPSGALLKAVLIHSGIPVSKKVSADGSSTSTPGYPSNNQGYGRIAIDKVLVFGENSSVGLQPRLYVKGGAYPTDMNYVSFNQSGDSHDYYFTVGPRPPSNVRVTVAYTDLPAFPSQSSLLINKISATVTDNKGTIYRRLNAAWAADNVLVFDLKYLPPNTSFTATICSVAIFSEQPYALVVSGFWLSDSILVSEDEFESVSQNLIISKYIAKIMTLAFLVLLTAVGTVNYFSACEMKMGLMGNSEEQS